MPSTTSSITSKAPEIPANAHIRMVTRSIGTVSPKLTKKKLAIIRTMMPRIEFTAKYLPNLTPSFTRT
jgi:hypothetical protein